MLREPECVVVDLLAESADEVADLVLDLGELGLRLRSHLHQVHRGVDVACREGEKLDTFILKVTEREITSNVSLFLIRLSGHASGFSVFIISLFQPFPDTGNL